MNDKDYVKLNQSIYLPHLLENGDSHLSLNWGSKKSQEKRFQALIDISFDVMQSHILDVGCGLGHLLDYLKINGFEGNYTGTDILEEMIRLAKERHPTATFETKELDDYPTNFFDYVFMSGIFTFSNEEMFKKIITTSWKICNKGVAFNALSLWGNYKESKEFYIDPVKTLAFCHTLTSKITLKHEYLPHDLTIYLYK